MLRKLLCGLLILSLFAACQAEEVRILISAAGDCILGGNTGDDGFESFQRIYAAHGDAWFLENVKDIFENDDLTIVNFEGAVTGEEYTAQVKEFTFRCLPESLGILTGSGVDCVSIANNHSKDFGNAGYLSTKTALRDAGLGVCGYSNYAKYTINGIRVTVCGFTWWQKRADVIESIRKLRSGCDLLIVCMHWGEEGVYYVTELQQWWAYAIIDAGADVILGSHTHLVSGIEQYNGRYIVYSMGNFCFGGNFSPPDLDTFIFQEEFTFTDGSLSSTAIKLIPCLISSESGTNNMQPVPAKGTAVNRITDKIRGNSPKNWKWPAFNWIED